jgi:DNA primase
VAQFIVQNIDDVIDNFDGELYKRIAKEFQVLVERGDALSVHYFRHHEAQEFRQLAIDMAVSPYEYSENWEKKWDVVLNQRMPDQNFKADSALGLKRFRLRKLSRICQQNIDKIKQLSQNADTDELLLYMSLQQRLQTLRNDLAKELGTVVF